MNEALTRVLVRRERILTQIGHQREAIAAAVAGLSGPIAIIDGALLVGCFIRAHPVAVALLAGAMFVLRGRGLLGMLSRGFSAWGLFRQIRAVADRLGK